MTIFGCIAYAKVLDYMRGKLDAKGTRCIFLGYCEGTKAYRFMCLGTQKIIKSRDVEFLEHKSASRKWEICPSGSSGVIVDTSPIPRDNQQEDREDHSQSEDNGKEHMEVEEEKQMEHPNTSIPTKYNKANHGDEDEEYLLLFGRGKKTIWQDLLPKATLKLLEWISMRHLHPWPNSPSFQPWWQLEQPQRFIQQGKHHFLCKLMNLLYGLKQSP
jgi:hypothetical protein